MRLRTDIFVAALTRRAEAQGAFVSIIHRGHREAGTVFVHAIDRDRSEALYGPAPPQMDDSLTSDRLFSKIAEGDGADCSSRMTSERRFDPDLWLIEIVGGNLADLIEIVAEA